MAPNIGRDIATATAAGVVLPVVAKVPRKAKLGDVDDALCPGSEVLAALSEDGNAALKT